MPKTRYERGKNSIRRYRDKMAAVNLLMKPEEKEELKERAAKEGKSLAGYIKDVLFKENG